MKIPEPVIADFEFLRATPLDAIGATVGVDLKSDPRGFSALECWFQFDTHGKWAPCREIETLEKALRSKRTWNLQAKMWAEDIADAILYQEELVEYCHGLPDWIFKAVMAQAGKIAKERVGFVPRFIRFERVMGQWWPPYLDDFDPAI